MTMRAEQAAPPGSTDLGGDVWRRGKLGVIPPFPTPNRRWPGLHAERAKVGLAACEQGKQWRRRVKNCLPSRHPLTLSPSRPRGALCAWVYWTRRHRGGTHTGGTRLRREREQERTVQADRSQSKDSKVACWGGEPRAGARTCPYRCGGSFPTCRQLLGRRSVKQPAPPRPNLTQPVQYTCPRTK